MKTARTQKALAAACGTTRTTIGTWLKMDGNPGRRADGSFSVTKWKAWIAETGLGTRTGAADRDPRLAAAKAQKLKLQAEKIALETEHISIENAVSRGELFPEQEAAKVIGGGFGHMITALRGIKHRVNCLVAGRTTGDAELILEREIREALAQWEIPRGLEKHAFFGPLRKKLLDLNAALDREVSRE